MPLQGPQARATPPTSLNRCSMMSLDKRLLTNTVQSTSGLTSQMLCRWQDIHQIICGQMCIRGGRLESSILLVNRQHQYMRPLISHQTTPGSRPLFSLSRPTSQAIQEAHLLSTQSQSTQQTRGVCQGLLCLPSKDASLHQPRGHASPAPPHWLV